MSDWARVLDRQTPYGALDSIVEAYAAAALRDLAQQLDQDDALTPAAREAILARVTPQIAVQTRTALEAAWQRLQSTH